MLEVRLLTKLYSGIPAVDHVSFTIRPGDILGYLGPNGAGKSTTVKMLTGLLEPTSGHILFHGDDVRHDLKSYQRRIGYVPEEPHLYPHLSGREYLQLTGRLRGMPRLTLERKMDELLRLVSLWEDRHSPLAGTLFRILSHGHSALRRGTRAFLNVSRTIAHSITQVLTNEMAIWNVAQLCSDVLAE